MLIDDRTVNFNLPLPNPDNFLFDDIERIRGAFAQIDHELHGLSSSLLGVGGNSASGSITLTSSSETIQSITPTESGNYVTLPDAMTMNNGIPSFAIQNAGSHDLGIMDSAGKKLGWIRSGQTGIIGLVDNTTVKGVWVTVGVEKLGVTASKVFYSLTGMSISSFGMKAIAVDQNRTLILFGATVLNAIVYDANTRSFGQPTVVIASIKNDLIEGILVSTDKVLVLGATASDLRGVVLSLSGTAISVGPPGTRSTNIPDKMGMLVELGSSGTTFAFAQGRTGPFAEICAISISNDTVSIGDTLALDCPTGSESGLVLVPDSESTVLALNSNGINISAKIHSISGITVTPGSAALLTTDKSEFRWLVLPSGRVAVIYTDLNKVHGAIISVTGMTASASDVVLGDYDGGTSTFLLSSIAAVAESGKVVVVNNAGSNFLSSNILTDSSGVASAGTASIIQLNTSLSGFNIVSVSGDVISLSIGNDTSSVLINVDVSGVSPVMDIVDSLYISVLSRQNFIDHAVDITQFNYRKNSLGNGSEKYAPNLLGSPVSLGYTSKKIFKVDSPVNHFILSKAKGFGASPGGNDLWVVSCSGPTTAMIACLEAAE